MLYSLILALNLILVLLGLYFLFHTIIFSFLLKGEKNHYILVPAREEDDDLFDKIYRAHIQINMFSFSQTKPVYVVDYGLSQGSKTRLLSYFAPFGQIVFVDKDSAIGLISEYK